MSNVFGWMDDELNCQHGWSREWEWQRFEDSLGEVGGSCECECECVFFFLRRSLSVSLSYRWLLIICIHGIGWLDKPPWWKAWSQQERTDARKDKVRGTRCEVWYVRTDIIIKRPRKSTGAVCSEGQMGIQSGGFSTSRNSVGWISIIVRLQYHTSCKLIALSKLQILLFKHRFVGKMLQLECCTSLSPCNPSRLEASMDAFTSWQLGCGRVHQSHHPWQSVSYVGGLADVGIFKDAANRFPFGQFWASSPSTPFFFSSLLFYHIATFQLLLKATHFLCPSLSWRKSCLLSIIECLSCAYSLLINSHIYTPPILLHNQYISHLILHTPRSWITFQENDFLRTSYRIQEGYVILFRSRRGTSTHRVKMTQLTRPAPQSGQPS